MNNFDEFMNIKQVLKREGTDKGKWYGDLYDVLLRPLRQEVKCLIEIGIGTMIPDAVSSMVGWASDGYSPGGSLRAWKAYFPNAHIHGFDVAPDTRIDEPRITTHLCDSTIAESVAEELRFHNLTTDIVIDDGLHTGPAQAATLRNFLPALRPGGLYIVEDVMQQSDLNQIMESLLVAKPDASTFLFHTSELWSALVIRIPD